MAMTITKLRSGVQYAMRTAPSSSSSSHILKRSFSSSHHDEAYEAKEASKWEKITYLGIISCTALALYNLSKPHHHFPEPPVCSLSFINVKGGLGLGLGLGCLCCCAYGSITPNLPYRPGTVGHGAYPYMHIRNKEFPWGPDGLFEVKEHH